VKLSETISGWPAGTVGTVVSDRGETVLVEIAGEASKALGFVQAPVWQAHAQALTNTRSREESVSTA
jgi:hypothetical protein